MCTSLNLLVIVEKVSSYFVGTWFLYEFLEVCAKNGRKLNIKGVLFWCKKKPSSTNDVGHLLLYLTNLNTKHDGACDHKGICCKSTT